MMVLPFGLLFTAILTADVSAFSGLQSYARASIPAVVPPKPSTSLQFDCAPNVYSASARFAGSNALGGLGVSGNHNANVGFKGAIGPNSYSIGYNDNRDDKYDASYGDEIGGRFSGYGRIGGGSGYGHYGTGSGGAGAPGAPGVGGSGGGVGGGGGGGGDIVDGTFHGHGGHRLGDWRRNGGHVHGDWGRNGGYVHGDYGGSGGIDYGDYGAQYWNDRHRNGPHWRHSLGDSGTTDTIWNC